MVRGGKAKTNNREISSTIATIKIQKTDSESPSSVKKCRISCFLIEGHFVHNVFALEYNGILWHNSVLFQVHFIDTKTDFCNAKKVR